MELNTDLKKILKAVQDQELSPEEAMVQINTGISLPVGKIASLDCFRKNRCGIPEVILAEGKDPDHLFSIAVSSVMHMGRCMITRVQPDAVASIREWAGKNGVNVVWSPEGRVLILGKDDPPQKTGGMVGIISAGTSDIRVGEEARMVAEEMGCTVKVAYDVGVAGLHRVFPALSDLEGCHAYVVAAGREGTLPSIVAGLINRPVIGVPVSTGYGYMGGGQAALASMLQSCSVITVVNIDAGFVAGAYAAMIANMVVG
jgi:pyridinium-3,5-biscarboxylic acid mononucleotide synthase